MIKRTVVARVRQPVPHIVGDFLDFGWLVSGLLPAHVFIIDQLFPHIVGLGDASGPWWSSLLRRNSQHLRRKNRQRAAEIHPRSNKNRRTNILSNNINLRRLARLLCNNNVSDSKYSWNLAMREHASNTSLRLSMTKHPQKNNVEPR